MISFVYRHMVLDINITKSTMYILGIMKFLEMYFRMQCILKSV